MNIWSTLVIFLFLIGIQILFSLTRTVGFESCETFISVYLRLDIVGGCFEISLTIVHDEYHFCPKRNIF